MREAVADGFGRGGVEGENRAGLYDKHRFVIVPVYTKFEVQNLRKQILTSLFESVCLKYKTDLIKRIVLKPIRLSAKCYDKRFAILFAQCVGCLMG